VDGEEDEMEDIRISDAWDDLEPSSSSVPHSSTAVVSNSFQPDQSQAILGDDWEDLANEAEMEEEDNDWESFLAEKRKNKENTAVYHAPTISTSVSYKPQVPPVTEKQKGNDVEKGKVKDMSTDKPVDNSRNQIDIDYEYALALAQELSENDHQSFPPGWEERTPASSGKEQQQQQQLSKSKSTVPVKSNNTSQKTVGKPTTIVKNRFNLLDDDDEDEDD
jgi:hypothetical protein